MAGRRATLVLPCDREAALAVLGSAIASTRRRLILVSTVSLAAALALLAAAVSLDLPGLVLVAASVLALFLAAVPLAAYAQAARLLGLLEQLRRGLEEGSIRLEEVCGRPLPGPGGPTGAPP